MLFADIVSSTEQIASLDPEQAMEHLQPAVRQMCAAIERVGGTVVRTLGDGVMALFGVPRALEGHALLACDAALGMQADFKNNQHGLSIRVGLHSGLVASDPASATPSWAQGAHGVAVHLASRVVALAQPGGICLSEDCYALVRTQTQVQSIGRHVLKGIAQPIHIYVLTSLNQAGESHYLHKAAMSPFRGRERELAMLHDAHQCTQQGQAQVIGISGAPGTGKSRLCYEFSTHCRALDIPVYEVRTQLYGHATPLQPALELLRTYLFRLPVGCDAATARQHIVERMSELGEPLEADLALLNDFLSIASPDEVSAGYSPKARRARLLSIVRELVRHSASDASVVVFEDLHWLDEASEDFVMTLVEAVAATRTLIVLNYRPLPRAPWENAQHFRKIDLTDLGPAETNELVQALLSQRREFQGICQLIAQRSAGNPFFAEELVRSMAESGALSGEPSEPKNNLESVARALPATVQAVIGARIDRLGEPQKAMLQMCAIIGKEITLDVLQHVAGPLVSEIDETLETLCRLELIQPQVVADGGHFSFRHPLIQEVAYGMQLKGRRASIHAAVAAAMEIHYCDQLDEYAGLVGHHYEAAGQLLNAALYIGRAARWVGSTNAALAAKHWHKVRSLLENQPHTEEADRLRAMASSQIALLGWREGLTLQEVQPYIDEATSLAIEVDGRLTQLLLMVEGRMAQASGGSADEYVERMNKALSLVPRGKDVGRDAMLNAALCQAYGRAGLIEQALAANDVALDGMARIDRFDRDFIGFSMEQWILGMRGRSLTRLGRTDDARVCWQQMLSVDKSSMDPTVEIIVYLGHVELAWCRGDVTLAYEQVERLTQLAAKYAVPYVRAVAHLCRGVAATIARETSRAKPAFADALALVRSNSVAIEFEPEILSGLAECHLLDRDFQRAHDLAREAIAMSRQRSARVPECRASIICGAAIGASPSAAAKEEAEALFSQAQKLVMLTGARIYAERLQAARSEIMSSEENRRAPSI